MPCGGVVYLRLPTKMHCVHILEVQQIRRKCIQRNTFAYFKPWIVYIHVCKLAASSSSPSLPPLVSKHRWKPGAEHMHARTIQTKQGHTKKICSIAPASGQKYPKAYFFMSALKCGLLLQPDGHAECDSACGNSRVLLLWGRFVTS